MEYVNEKLLEFNEFLKGRKVAVIGLGVSNKPLIEYLHKYKANVTVFDKREIDDIDKDIMDKVVMYDMEFSLGKNYLSKLQGFELIFRSPSCLPTIPEIQSEIIRGAIVTTEIELCPGKVIGITGSDGKTTTTSLIYEILKAKGYNCYLGGNIGVPLFTKIGEMTKDDIVVLELSSFQLMNMKISPSISVITNITPNHLDIHSSMEEYIEAKKNIFKYQDENGILVLNYDNDITREFEKEAKGKVIWFSSKSKIPDGYIVDENRIKFCENNLRTHVLHTTDMKLRGVHNFENACAAIAATKTLVDEETAVNAILNFKGVEHRLELIKETDNRIKWYNDSVSSSPTRTIAGLNAFSRSVILIAGGYDKNLDYTPIAKPIVDNVKILILLGQTSDKIFNAVTKQLEKEGKSLDIYQCNSLEQTVILANRLAVTGDTILFSPASASFDMFKNFADRGNKFKELVNRIVK